MSIENRNFYLQFIVSFMLINAAFAFCNNLFSQDLSWKAPAYTDTLKNPISMNDISLSNAKKIYNNVCWTCHGLEGKGDGPASVKMNPKPADHTQKYVQQQKDGNIFWKISMGKGDMQPFGKVLSARERWELVNYIRSLVNSNDSSSN